MKNSWRKVPLGEVLQERQEVPPLSALAGGELRILAKIAFGDGKIQLRSNNETRTGMILVRPGDLVVSGINAAKGAVAIYDEESIKPIAATIHYGAYIPNKERVRIKYLWWLLRSARFRDLLLEYLPGGIKTELKPRRLLKVPIPLPPLDEQERLVSRIDGFNEKLNEAKRYRYESTLAATRWVESCIDKTMARYTNIGRFSDVIVFKPRSGPSFSTNREWDGIPVIMPSAVTGFGVDIKKVEFGTGTEKISEKDILCPGDILLARGNKRDQVGNAGVVPKEAKGWTYANLLMRLQVDLTKVDADFCLYWLRSPRMRAHVRQTMTGTSPNIQKINQRVILDYPFPRGLSLSEQQSVVASLNELESKVSLFRTLQTVTSVSLNSLLPSVLYKAFNGDV